MQGIGARSVSLRAPLAPDSVGHFLRALLARFRMGPVGLFDVCGTPAARSIDGDDR